MFEGPVIRLRILLLLHRNSLLPVVGEILPRDHLAVLGRLQQLLHKISLQSIVALRLLVIATSQRNVMFDDARPSELVEVQDGSAHRVCLPRRPHANVFSEVSEQLHQPALGLGLVVGVGVVGRRWVVLAERNGGEARC